MPIVPAFDPATGASGGAAATTSASIGWANVGDLTAYSQSDPHDLVTAYAYAAGVHTLTLATIGVSSVDYNFGSGANFTGARWYWPLTYADGSAVLVQDAFTFSTRVTGINVGASRTWNIAFACVQNPTSTVLSTMDGMGTTIGVSGVGTPLVGAWRRNVVGTTSLAGGVSAYGQSLFGGAPGKAKVGASGIIYSASAGGPVQGLDANLWSAADNTQVYGVILVGSLGTATTTGGDFAFSLATSAQKLS